MSFVETLEGRVLFSDGGATASFSPDPSWAPGVTGRVFDDVNLNGVMDDGEAPIAGAQVAAYDQQGIGAKLATSDAEGRFVLAGLNTYGGSFRLSAMPGLELKLAFNADMIPFTVAAGEVKEIDIPARPYSSITGKVMQAMYIAPSQPAYGMQVFLDRNDNEKLDEDEVAVPVGGYGDYFFAYVPDGPYTVRPILPKDMQLASDLPSGTVTRTLFAEHEPIVIEAVVKAKVYLDENGNGKKDPFEKTVKKIRVSIDKNNNHKEDRGEARQFVLSKGGFLMRSPFGRARISFRGVGERIKYSQRMTIDIDSSHPNTLLIGLRKG
jgi:SdrD B-like protein